MGTRTRCDYSFVQCWIRWCWPRCYLAFRSHTLPSARQYDLGKERAVTMCILGEGRANGAAHRSRSRLTVHPIIELCRTTGLSLFYCRGRRPQGWWHLCAQLSTKVPKLCRGMPPVSQAGRVFGSPGRFPMESAQIVVLLP